MSADQRIQLALTLRRPGFTLTLEEEFSARGITALYGASGSGKSTLLRILAGLETAQGRILVNGECWLDSARGIFLPAQRRRVGLVFQRPNLFPHLSVMGNLRYGWQRTPKDQAAGLSLESVLHWLDLEPLLARPVQALSGGEQQRVAIGRALLSQPGLLLLDEPLSGVDVARRQHILPFLERLHQQLHIPLVLVSHYLDEVARLADWVIQLDQGQVRARGEVAALLPQLAGLGDEPQALLLGRVESHDQEDQLTAVQTPAGMFWVPGIRGRLGAAMRLLVRASHVSLGSAGAAQLSILNQLPVRVVAVQPRSSDQLIQLEAGGATLWALLSHRAVRRMAIVPGLACVALVKSVSVLAADEQSAASTTYTEPR